jgi:hypothetical protein
VKMDQATKPVWLKTLTEPRKLAFYGWFYAQYRPGPDAPRLYMFPEPLDRPQLIWKLAYLCNLRVTGDRAACDLACCQQNETWLDVDAALWPVADVPVINGKCVDISKSLIGRLHDEAFGYSMVVDPRRHEGPMVVKSEENAAHDGRVVTGPEDEPEAGAAYQILIDNEVPARGRRPAMVEDLRLMIVGSQAPVAYRKRRLKEERFANVTLEADVARPEEILSREEIAATLKLARAVGLDLGEIDLLRDRASGRVYAVDINKTPHAPPSVYERPGAGWRIMRRAAAAFEEEFVAPVRTK